MLKGIKAEGPADWGEIITEGKITCQKSMEILQTNEKSRSRQQEIPYRNQISRKPNAEGIHPSIMAIFWGMGTPYVGGKM